MVKISDNAQHTLLLVITSLLFILFTTGLAVPSETSVDPTIITTT